MTDKPQRLPVEPSTGKLPVMPVVVPRQPAIVGAGPQKPGRQNKNLRIVLGAVILGLFCLCSVVGIARFVSRMKSEMEERTAVISVLDSYMQYMMAKDIESAHALFPSQAKLRVPKSKLEERIEGTKYIAFQGYQSLSILGIRAVADMDTDSQYGIAAKMVTAQVMYRDDSQGILGAVLEK